MKLRQGDITSIANGRAFDKMALWGLIWSIVWVAIVALIAFLVSCPTGCWLSFVLLLLWFAGLMYKFMKTARAIRSSLYTEIKADSYVRLVIDSKESKEDKHEDI